MVFPAESIALYSQVHRPVTSTCVPSTLHERFGRRISRRISSFRIGATSRTQRAIRRMVNLHASLRHHFFEIAIVEAIPKILPEWLCASARYGLRVAVYGNLLSFCASRDYRIIRSASAHPTA